MKKTIKSLKTFYQNVNKKSRKEMIEFLTNHFRYDTMNSWNRSTSYANKVKIHSVIPSSLTNKVYELMESEDFYDNLNWILQDFDMEHNYRYQVGFNGRSSGYIVLYEGFCETKTIFTFEDTKGYNGRDYADGYGWKSLSEAKAQGLYKKQIKKTGTWPGRSIDQDENFSEWSIDSLKERVELIQDFDRMCDNVVAQTISMAQNSEIIEETVMIPKKVKYIK